MPMEYVAPMDGIQSARSKNWNPPLPLSKLSTSGIEMRKPMKATMFAHQRMRFFFSEGIRRRISIPMTGVKSTQLRMCSVIRYRTK